MFIYIHHISYCKLFLYFKLCLSVMLDSLSCSFTSITFLYFTLICASCFFTNLCLSVMLDSSLMFIYIHHISYCKLFLLMFIYIHHISYCKLFLYFNLCLNVMLDSFSCSFTSITFLTASCFFTLICV